MDAFFAAYSFPPPPADTHPHTHFQALALTRTWVVGSRNYRRATAAFHAALLSEFFANFGDAQHPDLSAWQKLCAVLGAKKSPVSIAKCKKFVKRTHVNMVDLMAGREVKVFRSREELMRYTAETGRYFPRAAVKENGGGLLRCLLREMAVSE